jgi:hypothetical protein
VTALALAALLAAAAPRPAGYRASAEESEVRLGEPFTYEIEVRHPPEESYALPPAPDLAPFHATPGACRRARRGDEVVTTCLLTLALLDLGPHDVPEIRLRVATPDGEASLAVPGPRVEGVGVLDPTVDAGALPLRDVAPPVPLLLRSWRLVAWAGALLAAAALALLAVRALRRRVAEPEAPVPAHERLARELDALEAEALAASGRSREHWVRLSAMVRAYLAAVTGVPARELTTGEIVAALGRARDPRIDLDRLRAFGEEADLVKFAREEAGADRCAAGVAFARELLARTRPRPTEAGA